MHMKKLYILLLTMFVLNGAMAQLLKPCSSCLPQGITFTTQAQVDNFQSNYPGCDQIEGYVTINGGSITNLNGLSVLTSIGGRLKFDFADALTNLTGLDNLTSVGGGSLYWIQRCADQPDRTG
jgi:hypothetical protein